MRAYSVVAISVPASKVHVAISFRDAQYNIHICCNTYVAVDVTDDLWRIIYHSRRHHVTSNHLYQIPP